MTTGLYKKGIVLGIIALFLGAGVTPNMLTTTVKADDDNNSFDEAKSFSDTVQFGLGEVEATNYSEEDGYMGAYNHAVSSVGGTAGASSICLILDSFVPEIDGKYEITFEYYFKGDINIKRFAPVLGTSVVQSTVELTGSVYDSEKKNMGRATNSIFDRAIPESTEQEAFKIVLNLVISRWLQCFPEWEFAIGFDASGIIANALDVIQDTGKKLEINDEIVVSTKELKKGEKYTLEFRLLSFIGSASLIGTTGGWNDLAVELKSITKEPIDREPPNIAFKQVPSQYPVGDTVTLSWKGESDASTDLDYKFYLEIPYGAEVTPPIGVGDLPPELGQWSDWTEEQSMTYEIPKSQYAGRYVFHVKVRDKWGKMGGPIKTAFNMFDFLIVPSTDKIYYNIGETVPVKLEITNKRSWETDVDIIPCFRDSEDNIWCIPESGPPQYSLTILVDETKSVIVDWKIPNDARPGKINLSVLTGEYGDDIDKYSNNLIYPLPLFKLVFDSTPVQLTTDSVDEIAPAWSPDGNKIAYQKNEGTYWKGYPNNIWMMNADGTNQYALTHSTGMDSNREPQWSPDGTNITFWTHRPWGQGGSIWTMKANGDYENKIYYKSGYDSGGPAYSPDGSKIVFDSGSRYGGGHDLYIMNSDGSNAYKIFNDDNNDLQPVYSPDGEWIAFRREVGGNSGIWVLKLADNSLIRLTTDPSIDYSPAWSPDGEQIAFTSDRSGNNDIWILANVQEVISGGTPEFIQVTTSEYDDRNPCWSPDGTKIAFDSDRSGNYDIWITTLKKPLIIRALSPVDLNITDPEGLTIDKQSIEIPGATYDETDVNGDNDPDDLIFVPNIKIGDYKISVLPEPDAELTDTYTLEVMVNNTIMTLAEDTQISDIPTQFYIVKLTEEIESKVAPIAKFKYTPETDNISQTVVFNASDSYDPDGNIVDWIWGFGDGVYERGAIVEHFYLLSGEYTVNLLVIDNENLFSNCIRTIIVDTEPPVTTKVVSNPKYNEYVTSHTEFNLTATDDLSGVDKTYYRIWYNSEWTPWTEYTGNFTLSREGKHYLEYYSVDNVGNVEEVHNQTHYVDDSSPELNLDEPITLWPPNHKYHTITLSDFVLDVCDNYDDTIDIDDVVITSVSSDEPENGNGDGNTWDDIVILDNQTVKLRAERKGNGNGRVYTINFEVEDWLGNTATSSFKIMVPHNKKSTAIDDGPDAGYTVYYP